MAKRKGQHQSRPVSESSGTIQRAINDQIVGSSDSRTPNTVPKVYSYTGTVAQQTEQYRGAFPPPMILQQFDMVVPGAAERIIALTEKQVLHRIELEQLVIRRDTRRADWGVASALVITISFLLVSAFLIYNGHDTAGAALGVVDLAALAGTFIYGTNSRKKERVEKAKVATGKK